ncbi:MAG: Recombination protein RecR [Parcubacteria group bacterium GW2011_GWD2_43_10]|uniref:Recombination protein RecR n=2 Tax=Candidatus Vebleniibacteriota TaxID=1817921 RepID=A0A1G2Q0G5_9BACT|nr:MAG: Recombination protein RecR [Parcubacteria group bacterium GW2011_GWD2_43_10]KKS92902.1 MAG: Recombination protein RecR [Parcubacteria group bacterium GW2011_GWE2_43_12]OHA54074.1 MAG: recombination protein RecR [Candidatus Veblenbacteria bacterium RIFOXYA2_FULL_43_9]OHA57432.1 MAG: recombination protein RecR [Candidatus Veblenbacteria bacterium RIFOXYC2_FULL_42_11]HAO81299.1 recombination protein RecR [Candidatus Veblenbacteria bacterium]
MSPTPHALEQLIREFTKLPGIGPKTAERLVYYLLKQPKEELVSLADSLRQAKDEVVICRQCFRFADQDPCPICADKRRDKSLLCVVAESQNIPVIEKTGAFAGHYHVLGGLISPLEGITPDKLKIDELEQRLKTNGVKEVILALNPDLDGETTSLYLAKLIKPIGIKVTRLARGLPMGADLEYADEVTLENAILGRKEIN